MNKYLQLGIIALSLVCGLALALALGIRASAADSGRIATGTAPAASSAGPLAASGLPQDWNPGVITYTFDADNMGWRSRDVYADFRPAPWAAGQIGQSFTNRGKTVPEDFAKFESPRLDPALSGTGGSISFTHNRSGTMVGQVLFSVCLRFSTPGVIPPGTLPCTPWRTMTPGAVTIPLTTAGEWGVYEYISIPFYPPYTATPLTEQQIKDILKAFRYIDIHYITMTSLCPSPQTSCLTTATVNLDDVRLEVTGTSGKLGTSTFYAQDRDTILFYAALKDDKGRPIRNSSQVTMTLTGQAGSVRMFDDGASGDAAAGDGVYSRWATLAGEGAKTSAVYYRGEKLDDLDVTVTAHPRLVALTDLSALYQGFLDTGMPAGQDDDGNGEIDFYQLLGRLAEYAAQHKGVIYDVRENIDTAHGFPLNYRTLSFAGDDPATNRIRMAKLIDEAVTRMHQAAQHTIADVVIIGADDVIPFYRMRDASGRTIGVAPGVDTPTATDLAAGYIITDLPYATVDYANQDAVTRPSPQIAVGRVTAVIPMGMIERLNAYMQPVLLDPQHSHATLFIPPNDAVHWSWLEENLWTTIFTRHYPMADMTVMPPLPGYYRYTSYYAWGPEDVLAELRVANLTVLTTRGDNRCDRTALPRDICGPDYGALAPTGGRLYVLQATMSGLSPAFYSPSGNRSAFQKAIPRWLQSVHRTQLGTTWLNWGFNSSVGGSDYLFANFVAEALDGRNATVGDAFVHAWDGYWTSAGADQPIARSVSYGMILWGLPTQPIQHTASAGLGALAGSAVNAGLLAESATPSRAWVDDEPGTDDLTSPALDRSFTVEISTPNFRIDADATGALLIRPATGGATFAEGPDLPLLPQVVKRFILPPNASDVRVTEDTAARVTQAYGPARLQTAQLHLDCAGACTIGAASAAAANMLPDSYPTRAFDVDIQPRSDGTVLTLAAVPAQVAVDGQLTFFTRMRFTVSYRLPAAPAVAITGLTVNAGQPVRAGTAAVPLDVNVTSATARPITLTWTVADASGFSLDGSLATANTSAGAGQVRLTLDATRWTAGPKTLSVGVADANGLSDAASASIQVLGLRLAAGPGISPVQAGKPAPLVVRAWDENGAAVTGLASRLTVQVDGAARAVTFTEGPAGRYTGALSTTAPAIGAHQVTVRASDNRGLAAEAWMEFTTARFGYLPLVLK